MSRVGLLANFSRNIPNTAARSSNTTWITAACPDLINFDIFMSISSKSLSQELIGEEDGDDTSFYNVTKEHLNENQEANNNSSNDDTIKPTKKRKLG